MQLIPKGVGFKFQAPNIRLNSDKIKYALIKTGVSNHFFIVLFNSLKISLYFHVFVLTERVHIKHNHLEFMIML